MNDLEQWQAVLWVAWSAFVVLDLLLRILFDTEPKSASDAVIWIVSHVVCAVVVFLLANVCLPWAYPHLFYPP